MRVSPDGRDAPGDAAPSTSLPITLDDEEIGAAWLAVVHHTDLGALTLLADVPEATARANPDVTAITTMSPEHRETLDAYCATGSLRQAADLLHLHHSTVSRRLEQIARTLDLDLTTQTGATRATLALTTWRLLDS
ncbi:helix-turn-helix domain-containing protein [Actinokineospora auranticolor]|uniref:PucR-like helix-turn-helix protein n=1 Tax=Actinokineospora auranticolor TaxID=155976 RepID=A0A2S6GN59_9PSEU|nr:helix-turn-helix domain-containing protein [Actinokineospora auranticolor]PPK66665.1 PucR-like helix-turn-helix protein [Actinokineospora auranticolor]